MPMSSVQCRKDRHNYQAVAGAAAGLGRRTCTGCGAVQIDLRSFREEGIEPGSVFAARRPTLFSVRTDAESKESESLTTAFGSKLRRRA